MQGLLTVAIRVGMMLWRRSCQQNRMQIFLLEICEKSCGGLLYSSSSSSTLKLVICGK